MVQEAIAPAEPQTAQELAQEPLTPTEPEAADDGAEVVIPDSWEDDHLPTYAEREDFKAWQEREKKISHRSGFSEGAKREGGKYRNIEAVNQQTAAGVRALNETLKQAVQGGYLDAQTFSEALQANAPALAALAQVNDQKLGEIVNNTARDTAAKVVAKAFLSPEVNDPKQAEAYVQRMYDEFDYDGGEDAFQDAIKSLIKSAAKAGETRGYNRGLKEGGGPVREAARTEMRAAQGRPDTARPSGRGTTGFRTKAEARYAHGQPDSSVTNEQMRRILADPNIPDA